MKTNNITTISNTLPATGKRIFTNNFKKGLIGALSMLALAFQPAIAQIVTHNASCPSANCELVENGSFNGTNCGSISATVTPHNTAVICNWQTWLNTPDLYNGTCGFSFTTNWHASSPFPASDNGGTTVPVSPDGGSFLGLWGNYANCGGGAWGWGGEAIQTQLAAPLIPGGHYHLRFYATIADDPANYCCGFWDNQYVPLQFYVGNGAFSAVGGSCTGSTDYSSSTFFSSMPSSYSTLTGGAYDHYMVTSAGGVWQQFDQDFVYTGPAATAGVPQQYLGIVNASYIPTPTQPGTGSPWTSTSWFNTYVFVDGVSITPNNVTNNDTTICRYSTLTLNGNSLIMDGGYTPPTDAFTWSPVANLSSATGSPVIFTPPSTGTFSVTVTETNYACTDTVNITVQNCCTCDMSINQYNSNTNYPGGQINGSFVLNTGSKAVSGIDMSIPFFDWDDNASGCEFNCSSLTTGRSMGNFTYADQLGSTSPTFAGCFGAKYAREMSWNFSPSVNINQNIGYTIAIPPTQCDMQYEYCIKVLVRYDDCSSCECTFCFKDDRLYCSCNNPYHKDANGNTTKPVFTPDNVRIYPNPNGGQFTVEMEKTTGSKIISLVDMTGRVVTRSAVKGDLTNFELNNVAAGTYNVVITGDGATISKKVVITGK